MGARLGMLPVDDFDKWCREKINYERSVVLRYIKAYDTFKDHKDLLATVDGQYKLFALLAHPEPVKYLEKHKDKIEDQTSREFREAVMEDRAKLTGDEKPGPDPVDLAIKAVKKITDSAQKHFKDLKKLSKRKKLPLDAAQQEALKLNLQELNEFVSLIKELLKLGKKS